MSDQIFPIKQAAQIDDGVIEALVLPRFMNYVCIGTTSCRHLAETPSSPGQWDLAGALETELRALGVNNVELTRHCYVIARIPASPGRENAPVIGFLAHLDTASDVPGDNVKPCLVRNYNGERIELCSGYALDPLEDADLASQKGKDIVHTDGNTLLGADDKAGIAEIVGALEYLLTHPELEHGPLEIIFSPDEETGKGLPEFPLNSIKSVACYTLDGGPLGELEVECFNAWKADITCTGKVIHVGHARGILANAALMAASFAVMLPRSESPEATDGYYGYYCPMEIKGDLEQAGLEVYIRDFDRGGAERRVEALNVFAKTVETQFPGGKVHVDAQAQYYNMKEEIDKHPEVFEKLAKAAANLGIAYRQKPIRGGTDGSRLTELGIPTPNIFTGGRNFHSRLEWVSVPEMTASCKLVIELIRLWGEV
ncbi:MAG: peptidase T [Treponema sp.]|nr:peptidase T [Treponema sp.]